MSILMFTVSFGHRSQRVGSIVSFFNFETFLIWCWAPPQCAHWAKLIISTFKFGFGQILGCPNRNFSELKRDISDIGAKFLYFQCFVTSDMFLFCKPIIFSRNCRICRDLAFGSVKTRFKAILKKLDLSAQIDLLQLFGEICRQKMPNNSKVKK